MEEVIARVSKIDPGSCVHGGEPLIGGRGMVNYGISPSSSGVLSAQVLASQQHAGPTDDSRVSALRAQPGCRGVAPRHGYAEACSVRPVNPARDLPGTLPHNESVRARTTVGLRTIRYGSFPRRRQTLQRLRRACVRQQDRRWAYRLPANGPTKLCFCSLSYFISHSLLRGPASQVATGSRSAFLARERREQGR